MVWGIFSSHNLGSLVPTKHCLNNYSSTVYHTVIQIIFQMISTNIRSLVEHLRLIWIKNIFITSENIDFTLLFKKKKKEQTEQTKEIVVVPAWTQIREVACPLPSIPISHKTKSRPPCTLETQPKNSNSNQGHDGFWKRCNGMTVSHVKKLGNRLKGSFFFLFLRYVKVLLWQHSYIKKRPVSPE